ncbi:MAG: hypothetical protein P8L36_17255 [SAR324 cluster bacterium]|nr:hypothetical protein [SAR324 cluster bacterium]
MRRLLYIILKGALPLYFLFCGMIIPVLAHHTLGINQTGKATASPQIPINKELYVGDYFISITVLPGHPDPQTVTRVVSYTKNLKTNQVFLGKMNFQVTKNNWFWTEDHFLKGSQYPIEDRHIQLMEFQETGNYNILLSFVENKERHTVFIELKVGEPINPLKYGLVIFFAFGAGWIIWKSQKKLRKFRPV